jgi:hypothetical protein
MLYNILTYKRCTAILNLTKSSFLFFNTLLVRHLKEINIVNSEGNLSDAGKIHHRMSWWPPFEYVYHHLEATQLKARKAGEDLQQFTWTLCAQKLIEIIDL